MIEDFKEECDPLIFFSPTYTRKANTRWAKKGMFHPNILWCQKDVETFISDGFQFQR